MKMISQMKKTQIKENFGMKMNKKKKKKKEKKKRI